MVSKTAEMVVKHCRALLYGAIHEQIGDLRIEINISQNWRQVNEHKFKVGNRVHIYGGGGVNGYCVRVTPKYVFYVREIDIFKHCPEIQRVGKDGRSGACASIRWGCC